MWIFAGRRGRDCAPRVDFEGIMRLLKQSSQQSFCGFNYFDLILQRSRFKLMLRNHVTATIVNFITVIMTMIIPFHNHDAHGCPVFAAGTSTEIILEQPAPAHDDCGHHDGATNVPTDGSSCSFSRDALTYIYSHPTDGTSLPEFLSVTIMPDAVPDITLTINSLPSGTAQSVSLPAACPCHRIDRRGPPSA